MLLLLFVATSSAVAADANYDEAQVPEYQLPDPLVAEDGTPIATAKQWIESRRGELRSLFEQHVYGSMPPAGRIVKVEQAAPDAVVFDGKAVQRQVDMHLKEDGSLPIRLLIYLPQSNSGGNLSAAFVGLNFRGNHTICSDEGILLRAVHSSPDGPQLPDESSRGAASKHWPVESIVGRGYALVTAHYGDIDPDFDDGFHNGVHQLYPEYQTRGNNWTSIGAWAWGLSRVLDYLETADEIDATRVAVIGHSRLGKTALWAGASDERFAMVVSNDSGCGGAALARRRVGETVEAINTRFPHWFCQNHKQYSGNESALPVDQHQLLALVAPRPLCVASATEDRWADPRGEFLSCVAASPVYELLGVGGLPTADWPTADRPIQGHISYHLRTGGHDLTAYDWQQYLDAADRHLAGP